MSEHEIIQYGAVVNGPDGPRCVVWEECQTDGWEGRNVSSFADNKDELLKIQRNRHTGMRRADSPSINQDASGLTL